MKKLGLVLVAVVAILFAGCKQEMKKEDIQKFVTDLTNQIKNNKIDDALKTAFTDDMKDDTKTKFKEALMGQEFKIIDIKDNQVTLEVVATAADGGKIEARTVIFKVIQVNGKIRLKDLVSNTPKTDGATDNANQEAPSDDEIAAKESDEIIDPEKVPGNPEMMEE